MNEKGKIAKIEWILLAATALFLCLLLGRFLRDRASMSAAGNGAAAETEILLKKVRQMRGLQRHKQELSKNRLMQQKSW